METNKPKEKNPIMEETKKQILKNSIFAVLIILCFITIFVIYTLIQNKMFSRIWQMITMLVLGISIIIFEIAYKKDSGMLALNGIEVLLFSCYVLTVQYITEIFNWNIKLYTIIVTAIYIIYYFIKNLILYTSGRKNYLNSLSDIQDIVKEDEPKKKKATKRKIEEGESND